MSQAQSPPHQRRLQQDWVNREYIEVITGSIKKIADFLNSFGEFHHHYDYTIYRS